MGEIPPILGYNTIQKSFFTPNFIGQRASREFSMSNLKVETIEQEFALDHLGNSNNSFAEIPAIMQAQATLEIVLAEYLGLSNNSRAQGSEYVKEALREKWPWRAEDLCTGEHIKLSVLNLIFPEFKDHFYVSRSMLYELPEELVQQTDTGIYFPSAGTAFEVIPYVFVEGLRLPQYAASITTQLSNTKIQKLIRYRSMFGVKDKLKGLGIIGA